MAERKNAANHCCVIVPLLWFGYKERLSQKFSRNPRIKDDAQAEGLRASIFPFFFKGLFDSKEYGMIFGGLIPIGNFSIELV